MISETATLDALDVGGGHPDGEAFLVAHIGADARVIALPDGVEVTVGRSRASTIFVDDERVSRQHARVQRRGADVFAADLGSRNGTRVGGVALSGERRMQAGEVLEVGPMRAVLALAAAGGAGTRAAAADGAAGAGADASAAGDVQVIADPAMASVYDLCRRVAAMSLSVLITGETGVGKERIAEAIQQAGPRARKPFVRLHVGALPDTLIESELFGHERGAFTGADRRHRGYFEAAAGGTLLLDEIGELPLPLQAKLLRVLESGRVVRLGSTEEIATDVRVIAATNRDLVAESRAGRFREDLFFRLAAFRIDVPPLRQRPAEIPLLAALFARQAARAAGRPPVAITAAAQAALARHPWPGNVRELRHVVEAALVLAAPGDIDAVHLLPALAAPAAPALAAPVAAAPPTPTPTPAPAAEPQHPPASLPQSIDQMERAAIVAALNATGGNQTRAAEQLGISRRTLLYKMKKLSIRSARVVE
jgi:DNA-binding NtrC family response regulator